MEKKQLIIDVSDSTSLTVEQAKDAVESMFRAISEHVFSKPNAEVEIGEFGKFYAVSGNAARIDLKTCDSQPLGPVAQMKFRADVKLATMRIRFRSERTEYVIGQST